MYIEAYGQIKRMKWGWKDKLYSLRGILDSVFTTREELVKAKENKNKNNRVDNSSKAYRT
uniref:Uncharacterized protein n=1 Tax=Octopus bimaculoides TaxID=37653 RepID=A0A0L8HUM8_OCTBM